MTKKNQNEKYGTYISQKNKCIKSSTKNAYFTECLHEE